LGIAAVTITHFVCRSHLLDDLDFYDLDSGNFTLGMERYGPVGNSREVEAGEITAQVRHALRQPCLRFDTCAVRM
jgi:hypothetical protein